MKSSSSARTLVERQNSEEPFVEYQTSVQTIVEWQTSAQTIAIFHRFAAQSSSLPSLQLRVNIEKEMMVFTVRLLQSRSSQSMLIAIAIYIKAFSKSNRPRVHQSQTLWLFRELYNVQQIAQQIVQLQLKAESFVPCNVFLLSGPLLGLISIAMQIYEIAHIAKNQRKCFFLH